MTGRKSERIRQKKLVRVVMRDRPLPGSDYVCDECGSKDIEYVSGLRCCQTCGNKW